MYNSYYFFHPNDVYENGYNKDRKFRNDRRPQNVRMVFSDDYPSHFNRYDIKPNFNCTNTPKKWAPNKNHNTYGKPPRNAPQTERRFQVLDSSDVPIVAKTNKPKPHKQLQQFDGDARDEPNNSDTRGNSNNEARNRRSPKPNGNNGYRGKFRQFFPSSKQHQTESVSMACAGSNQWVNSKDPPRSTDCQFNECNIWFPPITNGGALEPPLCERDTPMRRCLPLAQTLVVMEPAESLTNGSEWDKVSVSIWNKFVEKQQCEPVLTAKIKLWERIYSIAKEAFPKCGVYLVGSTLSGFGMDMSDVDICLMHHNRDINQRTEAPKMLQSLSAYVLKSGMSVENVEVIKAKVPLLTFRETRTSFSFDINCNNEVGIRNTYLLHNYARLEWRVRPLVILVKTWARFHDINDAKNMTLSSYSLTLMVIHFLQCGVLPAVLPCLQKLYREKFSPDSRLTCLSSPITIKRFKSENTLSLGELLLRFFKYYSTFDYETNAISVRLGCTITTESCRNAQTPKNDFIQWKYICIEEPYDQTNTARAVHVPAKFQRILDVITLSAKRLAETKDLASIFEPVP